MTRTQLADRAAMWFALGSSLMVISVEYGWWPLSLAALFAYRWGVARIVDMLPRERSMLARLVCTIAGCTPARPCLALRHHWQPEDFGQHDG